MRHHHHEPDGNGHASSFPHPVSLLELFTRTTYGQFASFVEVGIVWGKLVRFSFRDHSALGPLAWIRLGIGV